MITNAELVRAVYDTFARGDVGSVAYGPAAPFGSMIQSPVRMSLA